MSPIPDWQITKMLEEGGLKIEPFDPNNLTPNGYDLRIGEILVEGGGPEEEATVPPKTLFYIGTMERVELGRHLIGLMWIKTSWMRKGVLGSFGVVDAGYSGSLTLGGFNASSKPIRLRKGMGFAQIVFFLLLEPAEMDYGERSGRYQGSEGIVL